jgi:hypothetical protein
MTTRVVVRYDERVRGETVSEPRCLSQGGSAHGTWVRHSHSCHARSVSVATWTADAIQQRRHSRDASWGCEEPRLGAGEEVTTVRVGGVVAAGGGAAAVVGQSMGVPHAAAGAAGRGSVVVEKSWRENIGEAQAWVVRVVWAVETTGAGARPHVAEDERGGRDASPRDYPGHRERRTAVVRAGQAQMWVSRQTVLTLIVGVGAVYTDGRSAHRRESRRESQRATLSGAAVAAASAAVTVSEVAVPEHMG